LENTNAKGIESDRSFIGKYYIAQKIPYTASLFSGNNLLIEDYKWKDLISAYSGLFNTSMFVGQFWFLKIAIFP